MRVVFAPEVEEDLYGLIKILVEKEYLSTYPFAISYVEELIADIQQNIHSKLKRKRPLFLNVMVRICITSLINVILIRRGIFFSLSSEILILLNT